MKAGFSLTGQEKTQVRLHGARKFSPGASEERSLVAQWASEISLSACSCESV